MLVNVCNIPKCCLELISRLQFLCTCFILFSSGSQSFFLLWLPLKQPSWRHERMFPFLQKRLFTATHSSIRTKKKQLPQREVSDQSKHCALWHLINYTSVLARKQSYCKTVKTRVWEYKHLQCLYVQTVCKKKQIYADPCDRWCLT